MKYLIPFILFISLIAGCTPSKFIADNDKEQIFSHEVKLPKSAIKERLVMFVNEKYNSGKAVTQNNEEGLFSGNGISQVTTYFGMPVGMEFTFLVKYSDNSYKIKWIMKDVMLNNNSISQDLWGYYLESEEIKGFFSKNDKELFSYLSKANLDF